MSHCYQGVLKKEFTKVQDWLVAEFGEAVSDDAHVVDQQLEAYVQALYDSCLPN
jgi:hypothetical protein